IKPGSCRLSLSFFMSDAEAQYILDAILFIADYGACFLSQYEPDITTGEWTHKDSVLDSPPRERLANLTYDLDTCGKGRHEAGHEKQPLEDQGILKYLTIDRPKTPAKHVG
ncbi:unnamed protein product, partial [Sphacelaria rigidula]